MIQDICIFGSELAPSSNGVYIGGSATSAIRLAKSLADMGKRVHIVSMAPRDWPTEKIQEYEGPDWASTHIFDATAQHPGIFNGVDLLYFGTKELLDYCKENKIDIIHSHSGYSILAAMSVLAGKYARVPIIHTQYCPIPINPESVVEYLSSPLPARFTLNRADHVFAMTNNIQKSLHSHGIDNSSFVPPVVDTSEYHPNLQLPESVDIDDKKLTILFVGNIKADKGIEYLIEGAGKAKDDGLAFQLVLTTERDFPGSEERQRQLNRLIDEYDLQEDIVELGIIGDMSNVITHSDVLVTPFTTTSGPSDYPLVVLEAMASGTPVIASNVGGIPELLNNDRGILIPPESSVAIKRALQHITEGRPPDGGRAFVKERFAPDVIAQRVSNVYRENV